MINSFIQLSDNLKARKMINILDRLLSESLLC